MRRLRLGLVFGGRSVEHEVSLVSARAVLSHLDRNRYEVVPIGVARDGRWLTSSDTRALLDSGLGRSAGTRATLTADPSVGGLVPIDDGGGTVALDVVFPLVHGAGGEDGTLQGLLDLAGLPYVGSGVLGSSLGMDKAAMKTMFTAAGLPSCRHLVVAKSRLGRDIAAITKDVGNEIGYPCFTKPSNGGSSVGVTKVKNAGALPAALAEAACYDRKVIVEEAVEGQEVECAVLGNDEPAASIVGEIVPCHEFYDYSAKYLEEGTELVVPARLTNAQSERVRSLSLEAFKVLDCAGMARVDFFVRRSDGEVLINEVNTIPGFTPISMYPRLWEASGIGFGALVDRLVTLALERHQERQSLKRDYAPPREVPGAKRAGEVR
ncbi:MAG TPA: D-alanine--D-alanine ligase family protein [Candidatus Polarisedimenticolia bacterium]|nr:D-alanine--D-alanine ligase family protein [Candidatus Polarisedimenticolia bacterium]